MNNQLLGRGVTTLNNILVNFRILCWIRQKILHKNLRTTPLPSQVLVILATVNRITQFFFILTFRKSYGRPSWTNLFFSLFTYRRPMLLNNRLPYGKTLMTPYLPS